MAVQAPARAAAVAAPGGIHVITPRQPGPLARLRELWPARALVWWFSKDYAQRMYANTWLGWWWIPLRPLLAVVPRVLIFGGILHAPSNGVPYLLFFLVGFGAWMILEGGWYLGTRALQIGARYFKRMYLPRLALLLASSTPAFVRYLLYAVFTAIAVCYYTVFEHDFPLRLGLNTLLLPAALLMILALVQSLSLWTSVPGAKTRDTRWTVRAVTNVWFYLTPVIYPLSAVPSGFKTVAECNPMTTPMEMVRQAMFSTGEITVTGLSVSLGTIAVVGSLGLVFFSRYEAAALD
jgi:lipopolysaccharide transport system permease protein